MALIIILFVYSFIVWLSQLDHMLLEDWDLRLLCILLPSTESGTWTFGGWMKKNGTCAGENKDHLLIISLPISELTGFPETVPTQCCGCNEWQIWEPKSLEPQQSVGQCRQVYDGFVSYSQISADYNVEAGMASSILYREGLEKVSRDQ